MNKKQKKHIIIGNSAAGIAAIRTLRSLDPDAHIVCFSDEAELPYNKCFLADYLSGHKQEKDTYTITQEQLTQLRIDMRLGLRVIEIESDNKTIMLEGGGRESYDTLLLATGTRPFVPPIDQLDRYANVFSFHNLKSALQLDAYLRGHAVRRAAVIGAGLSGIEVADALTAREVEVVLIERGEQLLSAHISPNGSKVLQKMMECAGVQVMTTMTVASVAGLGQCADMVMLSDGRHIEIDMIVVTAGLRQNNELAQSAKLMHDVHGIQVDVHMRTSQTDIYAAGDIISVTDRIAGRSMASCTWPDAMQQGRCAAYAMAGKPQTYTGPYVIASSAFFGLKFYSCGLIDKQGYEIIEHTGENHYKKFLIENNMLKGFQLLGSGNLFTELRRSILLEQPLSPELKQQMHHTEAKPIKNTV